MTQEEELKKEIVSLQDSMKSLLTTIETLFDLVKDNREFIAKNANICCKTTEVLKDLADVVGGTMKVDAEAIKVSNKVNGGVPKIKKPNSMKDIEIVDLSNKKEQAKFLKKVKKLNDKYNES